MSERKKYFVFLGVYSLVALAVFYHTAWGFATLHGEKPEGGFSLVTWWVLGFLLATAIDVGMAAVIFLRMQESQQRKGLLFGVLALLAFFSAYAQLTYAAHHAASYAVGEVATYLEAPLQVLLDLRVIIFPIGLPVFALLYGYFAHADIAISDASARRDSQGNASLWQKGLAWLGFGDAMQDDSNNADVFIPPESNPIPGDAPGLELNGNAGRLNQLFDVHQMDEIDRMIIIAIRKNAKILQADLARDCEVNTSTISRRMSTLESKGAIKKVAPGQYQVLYP